MPSIQQFSLKSKLLAFSVFMLAIITTVGGISYLGLHVVSETFDRIPTQVMPKLEAANQMLGEYRRIRIELRTLGLPGLSKAQSAEAVTRTLDAIAGYEKARDRYVSYGFSDGQKPLYETVEKAWVSFRAIGGKVLDLQKTYESSGKNEYLGQMVAIFVKDCPEAAHLYDDAMGKLLEHHRVVAEASTKAAHVEMKETNEIQLLVAILGAIAGLGVGFIFAKSLSGAIEHVTDNLTKTVEQVTAASEQIAESSEGLSRSTTDQAASLQETASSLEQINAMIAKASDSAGSTAIRSQESQAKAEQGRGAVAEMLKSMDEIGHSNEEILSYIENNNRQMGEIVELIHEIGGKTQVINEIVFQTKLLSFNASVEAARAGEHGKGFAVVAEEVGNLARMSGSAATEISAMLDNSISKVETIVSETKKKVGSLVEQGKTKVASGVEVAQNCSTVLEDIVQNVSKVSNLAQEISQATREQAQGVSEINKAMGNLDQVTQQNAATSQQAASAGTQLRAQGDMLKAAVRDLAVIVGGVKKNAA